MKSEITHFTHLPTSHRTPYMKYVLDYKLNAYLYFGVCRYFSTSIVSKVSNIYSISNDNIAKFLLFTLGRSDFYWSYKNGVPFLEKQVSKNLGQVSKNLGQVSKNLGQVSKNAKPLTKEVISLYLQGCLTIGCSPFIDNEKVMFGGIDFDAHRDDDDTEQDYQKKVNLAQKESLAAYVFLKKMNLPVILNSSGSKGRHVRLLCPGALAKDIRIFLKWVLKETCGDMDKHEVFPKQDNLTEERPFGNQMKALMAMHPKHRKRANIISGGEILGDKETILYAVEIVDNLKEYSPIQMPEEDYKKIEEEQNKFTDKIQRLSVTSLNFESDGEVPQLCAAIDKVISKHSVPSRGKYNRHACLDPNIAAYGIKHPTARANYQRVQGRNSNTAFDNWSKYWKDKPVFKCHQIIAYLKNYAKEDEYCKEALGHCLNCPRFKKYQEAKQSPKGRACSLKISEIAKSEGLENCPICKTKLKLEDNRGLFYCSKCKVGGGLKKFGKVIAVKKLREATA